MQLRPSIVKPKTTVTYRFRKNPARVIVQSVNPDGSTATRYITLCASDGLSEVDLTQFLAQCLSTNEATLGS